MVRNAFVSVSNFTILERVPDSVARVCAKNEYGTGALAAQPSQVGSYDGGSTLRGV